MAALMPPDIQRQAYALIQALKVGDHEARLPLSDLFEEHGMPRVNGYAAEMARDRAVEMLRRPLPDSPTPFDIVDDSYADFNVGDVRVDRIWRGSYYQCKYFGPGYRVWIGSYEAAVVERGAP